VNLNAVPHPLLTDTRTDHGPAILHRLPTAKASGGVRVAEVGVCRGVLSRYLLERMPTLHLTMVDHWRAHAPGSDAYEFDATHRQVCNLQTPEQVADNLLAARWVAERFTGRTELIQADSIEAADMMDDRSFDLVFIDADHRYGSVVADIAAWAPKVRPGGWLGGHDYGLPGLNGAVDRAVGEFAAREGLAVELDAFFTWFIRLPSGKGGA
jgi:hypothetical protein